MSKKTKARKAAITRYVLRAVETEARRNKLVRKSQNKWELKDR